MTAKKSKKQDNARNILIIVVLVCILGLSGGLIAVLTGGNNDEDLSADASEGAGASSQEKSLSDSGALPDDPVNSEQDNNDLSESDLTNDSQSVSDDASSDLDDEDDQPVEVVDADVNDDSTNEDPGDDSLDDAGEADVDQVDSDQVVGDDNQVADADDQLDDQDEPDQNQPDNNQQDGVNQDGANQDDGNQVDPNEPLPDSNFDVLEPVDLSYDIVLKYDKLSEISANHDAYYDIYITIEGAEFKYSQDGNTEVEDSILEDLFVIQRTGQRIPSNNVVLDITPTTMQIYFDFDGTFTIDRDEILTLIIDPDLLVAGDLYEIASIDIPIEDCGSGTQNDPWTLREQLDLFMLAEDPNGYFLATQDITGNELDQVNLDFNGQPFTGVLDGDNYTVWSYWSHQPLFDTIEGGTIKDIKFREVFIDGGDDPDFKSLLAKKAYNANIVNVDSFACRIEGEKYSSALVGQVYDDTTISNCDQESLTIIGTYRAGGLVGYAKNTIISNCYVNANITSGEKMGGVCGETAVSDGGGNVTIQNTDFIGVINGSRQLGGIVGKTTGPTVIKNCSSDADITASNNRVGGIAGSIYGIINIQDCTTSGSLQAREYIGGIAGGITDDVAFGTITGCTNRIDTFVFNSASETLSRTHRIVGDGAERVTLDNASGIVTVTNNSGVDLSNQILDFDQYGPDGQLLLEFQPLIIPGELVLP